MLMLLFSECLPQKNFQGMATEDRVVAASERSRRKAERGLQEEAEAARS